MRLKRATYILCMAIAAGTAAPADEACDQERVFDELVAYFVDWKIAKRDYHQKYLATDWRALPSKGRAHYRIRVAVMVFEDCELKMRAWYQTCSWAGSASDPKCQAVEYTTIEKSSGFLKLAKGAVGFTENLRRELAGIAPVLPD